MNRMLRNEEERRRGEGVLSLSLSTVGSKDYGEFSERLDMAVRAGLSQLLLITFHPEAFRLAEIAPSERMMVNEGISGGAYPDMFVDTVSFVRKKYPELPVIVTPMIGDALCFGIPNFIRMCLKAGVDGMDTAQYPAIEDPMDFRGRLEKAGISFICAINGGAVRLDDDRATAAMDELTRKSTGELFYVPAIPGTTGSLSGEAFRPYIERIRKVQDESGSRCPIIGIGGINSAKQADELVHTAGVDGVHFSSAFMKRLFAKQPLEEIEKWLREVKDSMKG